MSNLRELLEASLKSRDTEEWLDVHFNRPIGLVFALVWNRLGVHPNVITLLSMVLGVAAAYCFYYTDLQHNLLGVALLMTANFCDSTDGQMARLSGRKSLLGRALDGFSGDVWFFSIYLALCLRLTTQPIPCFSIDWGLLIWVLAAVSGLACHAPQASLSDYYRQIHLFFLLGKSGSELDSYASQRAIYQSLPRRKVMARIFYYSYSNYCRRQERLTPAFQRMMEKIHEKYGNVEMMPPKMKDKFIRGSRKLMKYTNLLTFNARAISLYACCLLNIPWLYFVIEIVVFTAFYVYMHRSHESLCEKITEEIK